MKKTLVLAALLVGTVSAQAAFVPSDDTYAIINIPIDAGMNAVGISLLPMPGDTDAVQNIVLPEGLTSADALSDADQLNVFNGTGYTVYWLNNATTPPTWYTNNLPSSPSVAPGNAMWIKAKTGGKSVYQIGKIASDATRSVSLKAGNNFIANPFPADLNLTNVNWTAVAAENKFTISTADLIRIWTGAGYKTLMYIEGSGETTGWYDANTYKLAKEIPAGEGFWFFGRSLELPGTISVSNPFVQ